MKKRSVLALALALSLLAGCQGGMYVPVKSAAPAVTDDPTIDPTPSPDTPVVLEKVTPNGLVLRLLESECAQHEGESVILSPLSIEMALAMAANGADGAARESIETLLGMDAAALNTLLGAYLQREDDTLSLANSMWFNRSMDSLVKRSFKAALATYYDAAEGAFSPYDQGDAAVINGWVKDKTHGKIDGIVTADSLTDDTLAILINALYFNGKWTDPFEDWRVSEGVFHAPEGDQQADFMLERLGVYFETADATGFAKEYADGYEFIAILPAAREETVTQLLERLDVDAFLDSRTGAYDVDIKLPKFELEYSASLVETLRGLGLGSLFDSGSLNAMLTDEALSQGCEAHVSDVIHKTYMKMYEEGTEAAAVTAILVGCTALAPMEQEVKEVFLDRPFAFLIRDTQSGQIVFCGAINSVK